MIEERTLVDGGQSAEAIAARLLDWLGAARRSLDIAPYAGYPLVTVRDLSAL